MYRIGVLRGARFIEEALSQAEEPARRRELRVSGDSRRKERVEMHQSKL